MATPSAQFSLTLRVELPHESGTLGKVTAAITRAGGAIVAVDTVEAGGAGHAARDHDRLREPGPPRAVIKAVQGVRDAKLVETTDRTFELHRGGKIYTGLAAPVKTRDDLSMAYTPGVARICTAIAENRQKAFKYTIKANTVAVVTDGTAVLGLGDIGPEAAMPVMEGKAMLFKEFADVDAFPIALDTKDPDKIVETVKLHGAHVRRHQPRGHLLAALLRDRAAADRGAGHPGLPRRPARHRDRGAGRADQRLPADRPQRSRS